MEGLSEATKTQQSHCPGRRSNWHLPNTSQKPWRWSHLVRFIGLLHMQLYMRLESNFTDISTIGVHRTEHLHMTQNIATIKIDKLSLKQFIDAVNI
jgi:hypothetical protein